MPQRNSLRYTAVASWQNKISVKELVTVTRVEEKETVWIPRKFRIFSQLPSVSLTFFPTLQISKLFDKILKIYDGSLSFYGLSLSKILTFFSSLRFVKFVIFSYTDIFGDPQSNRKVLAKLYNHPYLSLYLHEHHYNCISAKLPFIQK